MREVEPTEIQILRWLLSRVGAWSAIVVVAALSALLAIAAPHIDMQLVALGIAILAICLGISLWNGARATTRLRSKISKLEKEILSLQSRPSPALKEVTHRDQVLVAVYEAGEDDSKLSEVTQLSQARVDDCLHELVKAGMIDQIMEPWETPHHVVIPKGRKYLLNNHLIE